MDSGSLHTLAKPGTVFLVGAGPGDPGLITVRGHELLASADVVIYDGLVGDGLLDVPRADAEMIYAGKKRSSRGAPLTQSEICERLVERAQGGASVVRLKGGDPLVFGRVVEELEALRAASIPFEIVPGVSSLTAAPAYAGIPITRRGIASTVAFATGHAAAGRALVDADFAGFAHADTVVLFMAVSTARDCADRLIAAGRAKATPCAAIHWGTTAAQRTIRSTLGELADAIESESLKPPALLVVGDVCEARYGFAWRRHLPLAGAKVLHGRPQSGVSVFSRAIATLGGEALHTPFTAIEFEDESVTTEVIASLESDLDWLLFSSSRAVEAFRVALLAAGRDVRSLGAVKIGCVGESTATALAQIGLRADHVPSVRTSAGLANELLAIGDRPCRVAVVRAKGGRDDAEAILGAAGVDATAVELYASVPTNAVDPALSRALGRIRAGEIDVIAFFAPSQVDALFDHLGKTGKSDPLAPVRIVAAIGTTTAEALTSRGSRADVIASRPDAVVLSAEIAELFSPG